MGASYWARWTSRESITELRNLLLPLVLAEGYDLLSWQGDWQMFDRGGIMQKLAWSLNGGGRWGDSPTVLTASYAACPEGTAVTFRWSLSIRPLPTAQAEQASFEQWVRTQMDRIVEGLRKQLHVSAFEEVAASADQPADSLRHADGLNVTDDAVSLRQLPLTRAATTVGAARDLKVHYAHACLDDPPTCKHCHRPALPVPGIAGRYYCVNCRRHLSCQPIA